MTSMKPVFLYARFERAREKERLNGDYKMARASSEISCQQAHDRRKLVDRESCEAQLIYCLRRPSDNRGRAAEKRDRCLTVFVGRGIPAECCCATRRSPLCAIPHARSLARRS